MNCKTAKIDYIRLTDTELKFSKKIGHLNRLLSGAVADPNLISKLSDELVHTEAELREVQTNIDWLVKHYGFLRKEEKLAPQVLQVEWEGIQLLESEIYH